MFIFLDASAVVIFHMDFWKLFSVNYPSSYSILCPAFPYLALPNIFCSIVLFPPLCITMLYLPFFKISPSSWVLTNFLTSVCIPNETHISQYLKLASINERKYNVCHFGPYHAQTVYRSVHFTIVFVIGFSSYSTRWNTYLTPLSGPRICHYVAYGL